MSASVNKAQRSAYQTLWPWERATLTAADLYLPGWLPLKTLNPVTLLAGVLLAIGLPAPYWPLAWVLARLAALDLTTYILADIYTIPLLTVGLANAAYTHQWGQALAALVFILAWLGLPRTTRGLGGGDFKLLAALLAWLPLQTAAMAVAVGCVVWLPMAFLRPKSLHPFGLPLVLGWAIILRYPHLPEWLLRPMLGG